MPSLGEMQLERKMLILQVVVFVRRARGLGASRGPAGHCPLSGQRTSIPSQPLQWFPGVLLLEKKCSFIFKASKSLPFPPFNWGNKYQDLSLETCSLSLEPLSGWTAPIHVCACVRFCAGVCVCARMWLPGRVHTHIRVSQCVCVPRCAHLCPCVYTYIGVHVCMCVHMSACVSVRMFACVNIRRCACVWTHVICVCECTCAFVYTCVSLYACVRMRVWV